MIKHYIKIALRNLAKQKGLAFINIAGLSTGIACFTLFLLYSVNEFSFDRFHKNANRIFRINQVFEREGREMGMAGLYMPLGPSMKKDFPDVENYVRFASQGQNMVRVGNTVTQLPVTFADPQVLSVFSFPLISGTDAAALQEPGNIILTRQTALQLFGEPDVVGKIVDIKVEEEFKPFKVGAVAEDLPANSSIRFSILGNYDYLASLDSRKEALNSWHMTFGDETYVQLRKGSTLMNDNARLSTFMARYYPEETAAPKKKGGKVKMSSRFVLQPLRDVHTAVNIDSGPPGTATNPKNVWILISIATGVLLIACINFTTLAIGRSAGRSKEVGVRKVIGGRKTQLIYQFLTESLLLSIFSAALGLLLANSILPYFNQLAGTNMQFSFKLYPELAWMLAGLILLIGLLAGSYPALILSSFKPVEVLKSRIKIGGSNLFTKSLVTFQFVLSIGLIIATLIMLQQLRFMRSKDIGFNKENVVMIDAGGTDTKKIYSQFRERLAKHAGITGIAGSEMGLGDGEGQMGGRFEINGKELFAIEYPVDPGYLNVLGMQLIAGRDFSRTLVGDTIQSIIVNESFVKNNLATTPEKAIGFITNTDPKKAKTIIGVVKDFNYEPLTRTVRPQLFRYPADFKPGKFFVRIKPGNPTETIAALEAEWKNLVPDIPFRYNFLDEKIDQFYKSEQRWSTIINWAGGMSIFLACLGLFGLAALSAVNRAREIGIRKVLGAPMSSILELLSKDFLKLILIALLIASPLAWYFMHSWLTDFVYRIDIGWTVFVLAGVFALGIAFVTISLQGIRAAMVNPVNSLKEM